MIHRKLYLYASIKIKKPVSFMYVCVSSKIIWNSWGLSMQDIALTILKGIFQTIIIFQENFKYIQ